LRSSPSQSARGGDANMSKQNIEAIYRLSPMQEGLLFHSLEAARSGVYFNQFACTLEGPVDVGRFQAAWDAAAKRHPVLRSLFTWERHDQPLQIVRNRVTLPWTHLDWRNNDLTRQEQLWRAFLEEDRSRGFRLEQAPVVRFALIRVAETRTRFLWSFHHIVLDGWSVRLVFDEVLQIYSQNEQSPPLAPAVPFAAFIAWLDEADAGPAKAFWTETLKGFESATPLPAATAPEHQAESSHSSASVRARKLSAALSARLSTTARKGRLTLNTVLVGAWAILLGRYSGQDDIVFGTTVSGRAIDLEGAERIAGPMLNTLPLRVRIQADQPLAAWLRDLQSRQASLRGFEQTPLSAIQRWGELPAGQSLFETILVFESFPSRDGAEKAESEVRVAGEEFFEWSNYPLALLVVPGECLSLILVYDSGRFSETAIDRLLTHLETLLEGMAADLNRPLSELSMIADDERRLVLETWNETQQAFPGDVSIQALIEPWSLKRPEALAVVSDGEELSYAELDQRVKRLARRLKYLGVGRDKGVPVFMERSTAAIVAILAAIYAGGAYVPVDPSYPEERVRQVLDDVAEAFRATGGRPVILTQVHLMARVPVGDYDVIAVDRDGAGSQDSDSPVTRAPVAPGNLAYIIHTSGSTGRPKGVMVSHRSLVNSTHARMSAYPEPLTSFLLLSSIATDSSVAGIFWALSSGATLVLPGGRQEQDIQQLAALIDARRVTHLLCVPSLYGLILENDDLSRLNSLRSVLVAGEACSTSLVRRHHHLLPAVALYNEYGPTEGTVWATVARLEPGKPVTIGRPIANVALYVLDEDRAPVPVGLPGELYIGGEGVARGYLNQPDLTERSFVPNLFRPDRKARLYRTGDRVRHTPEGEIEYLGRVDNQIKVRGFRVEPEEVERSLARHPGIDEVVVVLSRPGPRDGAIAEDPGTLADAIGALGLVAADRLLTEMEGQAEDVRGLGKGAKT